MEIAAGMTETEFETTYKRPTNPNAVRNAGKTVTFRVDPTLARAINRATDVEGYRFTSEFIRAAIIKEIERIIREA